MAGNGRFLDRNAFVGSLLNESMHLKENIYPNKSFDGAEKSARSCGKWGSECKRKNHFGISKEELEMDDADVFGWKTHSNALEGEYGSARPFQEALWQQQSLDLEQLLEAQTKRLQQITLQVSAQFDTQLKTYLNKRPSKHATSPYKTLNAPDGIQLTTDHVQTTPMVFMEGTSCSTPSLYLSPLRFPPGDGLKTTSNVAAVEPHSVNCILSSTVHNENHSELNSEPESSLFDRTDNETTNYGQGSLFVGAKQRPSPKNVPTVFKTVPQEDPPNFSFQLGHMTLTRTDNPYLTEGTKTDTPYLSDGTRTDPAAGMPSLLSDEFVSATALSKMEQMSKETKKNCRKSDWNGTLVKSEPEEEISVRKGLVETNSSAQDADITKECSLRTVNRPLIIDAWIKFKDNFEESNRQFATSPRNEVRSDLKFTINEKVAVWTKKYADEADIERAGQFFRNLLTGITVFGFRDKRINLNDDDDACRWAFTHILQAYTNVAVQDPCLIDVVAAVLCRVAMQSDRFTQFLFGKLCASSTLLSMDFDSCAKEIDALSRLGDGASAAIASWQKRQDALIRLFSAIHTIYTEQHNNLQKDSVIHTLYKEQDNSIQQKDKTSLGAPLLWLIAVHALKQPSPTAAALLNTLLTQSGWLLREGYKKQYDKLLALIGEQVLPGWEKALLDNQTSNDVLHCSQRMWVTALSNSYDQGFLLQQVYVPDL